MIICKQCLMEIENHEGWQNKVPLIHSKFYNEENEYEICEWCEFEESVENMVVI